MKIVKQSFELFNPRPAEEAYMAIDAADRIFYRRSEDDPERRELYIRGLIRTGRESVLEHVSISALITTSQDAMVELARHKWASFTVESARRGADMSRAAMNGDEDLEFLHPCEGLPPEVRTRFGETSLLYLDYSYKVLRLIGVPPWQASPGLPMCLATRIFMTANVREWRRVIKRQTSPAAHPLMRALMLDGLGKLKALYPVLFEDIQP